MTNETNVSAETNETGGLYWIIPNDGAPFRCTECQQLKPHSKVILTQHTVTGRRSTLCLECVDQDWLRSAHCLGVIK